MFGCPDGAPWDDFLCHLHEVCIRCLSHPSIQSRQGLFLFWLSIAIYCCLTNTLLFSGLKEQPFYLLMILTGGLGSAGLAIDHFCSCIQLLEAGLIGAAGMARTLSLPMWSRVSPVLYE